jgi:hypothetical protein
VKRHLVWIALMMTAWGCGGNTTNGTPAAQPASPPAAANTAPSPGPASAFDAVDGDPPHHQNLIVMTKNDNHDANLDASCLGTVTTYQLRAKRKQKIRWHIQNDLFNECQDLDESLVEVRFDNAVMAETTDPGAPALSILMAVKGKITARVHADPTHAADGHYKYSVYYLGKRASDPALDISGECGACGPGGGQ